MQPVDRLGHDSLDRRLRSGHKDFSEGFLLWFVVVS